MRVYNIPQKHHPPLCYRSRMGAWKLALFNPYLGPIVEQYSYPIERGLLSSKNTNYYTLSKKSGAYIYTI